MRRVPLILLAILAVGLASEGDICLAFAMRHAPDTNVAALFVYPPFLTALSLLVGHFALWMWVLARLELSVAVPITACSYIFNLVLCRIHLGETVSPRTVLGTLLIGLGVVIVSRTQARRQA